MLEFSTTNNVTVILLFSMIMMPKRLNMVNEEWKHESLNASPGRNVLNRKKYEDFTVKDKASKTLQNAYDHFGIKSF